MNGSLKIGFSRKKFDILVFLEKLILLKEIERDTKIPNNPVPGAIEITRSLGWMGPEDEARNGAKGLTSPEQMATVEMVFARSTTGSITFGARQRTATPEWNGYNGKIVTSNPFKNFNDSPLTGVNTPGSDENRLKLYDLMYILSLLLI
ncbi:hypothetical protein Tco_0821019 [Tanacetum coccineum]|uniref:Uncharacterized protein n=1 Tax=Tanacetum coccineum TaxID=301880 RepID=A0ABQ5AB45_9ASTR